MLFPCKMQIHGSWSHCENRDSTFNSLVFFTKNDGYIMNSQSHQLPIGLIAQLIRGHGFETRSALNYFSGLNFTTVPKMQVATSKIATQISDKKTIVWTLTWHVSQDTFGWQPTLHKAKLHFTLRNNFWRATSISSVHALPRGVTRSNNPQKCKKYCKKSYARHGYLVYKNSASI